MSSSGADIFFLTVLPLFGNFTAISLYLSSIPSLRLLRKQQGITPTTPDGNIYCLLLSSCLSWSTYGYLQHESSIAPLNTFGAMVAFFSALSYYAALLKTKSAESTDTSGDTENQSTSPIKPPSATVTQTVHLDAQQLQKKQRHYERLFLACAIIPITLSCILTFSFAEAGGSTQVTLAGIQSVTAYCLFLTTPLTLLRQIFATRDASALSLPLTVVTAINCTLWTVYGGYKGDLFIAIPNGTGIALNCIQLGVIYWFKTVKSSEAVAEALKYDAEGVVQPTASGGTSTETHTDLYDNDTTLTVDTLADTKELYDESLKAQGTPAGLNRRVTPRTNHNAHSVG